MPELTLTQGERSVLDEALELIEKVHARALRAAAAAPGPVPADVYDLLARQFRYVLDSLAIYTARQPRSFEFARGCYDLGTAIELYLEGFPSGCIREPIDWDKADPTRSLFAQMVEKLGAMIWARNLQTCVNYAEVEDIAYMYRFDRSGLSAEMKRMAYEALGGLRDCINWDVDTDTWE